MSDSTQPASDQPNSTPAGAPTHAGVNGQMPPDVAEAAMLAALDREAKELLLPAPSALAASGHQTVIPVVKAPLTQEFFRTHPILRFTMAMVEPKKGLGAHAYAVLPAAMPYLARAMIEPFTATLFPIVIATRPLSYKLIMVKTPSGEKRWDGWNLSKKLVLDEAVTVWRAMRNYGGDYRSVVPDATAVLPEEAVFPDYSAGEWIHKSLGVTDLIIRDGDHPVLKEINCPKG